MIAEIVATMLFTVAWALACSALVGCAVANTGGLQNLAAVWKRWMQE